MQHSHVHSHDMDGDMDMDMGGMMSMAFHFGSKETILFEFWKTETSLGKFLQKCKKYLQANLGIVISSLLLVLLCFLMEFIRWIRLYMKRQRWGHAQPEIPQTIGERYYLIDGSIFDTIF